MPPVLSTERIAPTATDRRLLRCGISIQPMTAAGRPGHSATSAQRPVCPKTDIAGRFMSLMCNVRYLIWRNRVPTSPSHHPWTLAGAHYELGHRAVTRDAFAERDLWNVAPKTAGSICL